ncbi:tRNA (adenosine(37)-N6)-threonylcarbamoyltransferase complex ATPase subunit type 1 TsaE [Rhabdonatronobacter sediminivivens]|nr:tRNA (adenosine(37)-N6)-threonylcarbamoyltransferase complex ATPase subunit type 1 TsaE [Rhabdonatronobacter sediminivivens]
MDAPLTLQMDTADATAALARWLAPRLGAGDVLLLAGPVGAGKTHFARALIQARLAAEGLAEDVPSPSFTLVQTYWAGALEIWHVDLYRLGHADEAPELGLDEAFDTALCLIEWPERLGALAPDGALWLQFADGRHDAARQITLSASAPRWAGLLAQLRADFGG